MKSKDRVQYLEVQDLELQKTIQGLNVFTLVFKNQTSGTVIASFSALSQRMALFDLPLKHLDSDLSILVIFEKDYILSLDKANEGKQLFSVNSFQSIEVFSRDKLPAVAQAVNFMSEGRMIGGVQIDFVEEDTIKQLEVAATLNNMKPLFKPFERVSFTSFSEHLSFNDLVVIKPKCPLGDTACFESCQFRAMEFVENNLVALCGDD